MGARDTRGALFGAAVAVALTGCTIISGIGDYGTGGGAGVTSAGGVAGTGAGGNDHQGGGGGTGGGGAATGGGGSAAGGICTFDASHFDDGCTFGQ